MTQGHAKEEWNRLTKFPLGKKQEQRKPSTHTHIFRALYTSLWHSVLEGSKGLGTSFFLLTISNSLSHYYRLVFQAITSDFLSIPHHIRILSYQFAPVLALGCFTYAILQRDSPSLVIISTHIKLWHPSGKQKYCHMDWLASHKAKLPYCCYWRALRTKCQNVFRLQWQITWKMWVPNTSLWQT